MIPRKQITFYNICYPFALYANGNSLDLGYLPLAHMRYVFVYKGGL